MLNPKIWFYVELIMIDDDDVSSFGLRRSVFFLLRTEHETSTLCLQPILPRAVISASHHVRPIDLICCSTVIRRVDIHFASILWKSTSKTGKHSEPI